MFGFLKRNKKKKEEKQVSKKQTAIEKTELEKEASQEEVHTPEKKKRKAAIHITKHKSGGWQVKKEGAQRALKLFKTQKEAIDHAKLIEKDKGTGYIIHKADGSTRKKKY